MLFCGWDGLAGPPKQGLSSEGGRRGQKARGRIKETEPGGC